MYVITQERLGYTGYICKRERNLRRGGAKNEPKGVMISPKEGEELSQSGEQCLSKASVSKDSLI